MSTDNIITLPFRLAFPEIFEARAVVPGGVEKFSITMLFPKDGANLVATIDGKDAVLQLRKLAVAAVKEKWGDDKKKWPTNLKALDMKNFISATGKDGWPFRDGDMVEWDGFEGQISCRAVSKFPPGLVDAKRQDIIDKSAVYGGLICRAQINAYAYDTNGNRGVTFGLNNLQILKDDGVNFGRNNAADAFDSFSDGSDDGFNTTCEYEVDDDFA